MNLCEVVSDIASWIMNNYNWSNIVIAELHL